MDIKENKTDNIVSKKKKVCPAIIGGIFAVVAIIVLVIVLIVTAGNTGADKKLVEQLELGEKYLSELNYEQAIASYEMAIEIDPMSVEAYLGLADAYVGNGQVNMALSCLQQGFNLTGDELIQNKMNELSSLLQLGDGMTVSSEETNENAENIPDWMINGIPQEDIMDVNEFKIGGVYFDDLTPDILLEMYGEYNNSYEFTDFRDDNYEIWEELYNSEEYIVARESQDWEEEDRLYTEFNERQEAQFKASSMYKEDFGYYDSWSWEGVVQDYAYHKLYADCNSIVSLDVIQRVDGGWKDVALSGENAEIGFAGIKFGDDFDTVLSKFGFTAEQITYIKDNFNTDTNSEAEFRNVCYCRDTGDVIYLNESNFLMRSSIEDTNYYFGITPFDVEPYTDREICFAFDADFKLISCSTMGPEEIHSTEETED